MPGKQLNWRRATTFGVLGKALLIAAVPVLLAESADANSAVIGTIFWGITPWSS